MLGVIGSGGWFGLLHFVAGLLALFVVMFGFYVRDFVYLCALLEVV